MGATKRAIFKLRSLAIGYRPNFTSRISLDCEQKGKLIVSFQKEAKRKIFTNYNAFIENTTRLQVDKHRLSLNNL